MGRQIRGKRDQRRLEDIGEDQAKGCGSSQVGVIEPRSLDAMYMVRHAIGRRIGRRHLDRDGVDIRGDDRSGQFFRRRDRQNGGAASDIGDTCRPHPVRQQRIECLKAALCRAVMPRAECHRRLDMQAHPPVGQLVGIMAAIDKEPPRLDRMQRTAHMRDPVGFGQFRDHEGLRAMGGGQDRQRDLVRAFREIGADFPHPGSVLDLEDADARGGRIDLFQGRAQRLGRRLSGQDGEGGDRGHGHGHSAGVGRMASGTNTVSRPGSGWRGTNSERISEMPAMPAASRYTLMGEVSHR